MHTDLQTPEKEPVKNSPETGKLIDIQLIRQLYEQAYPLTYAFPAVVAILAYILLPYVSTAPLVIWVCAIFLLSIFRYYFSQTLRRQGDKIENPQNWEKKYFFLELLAGFSVGMSTGFVNQVEPIYQMLLFLLTIGTCTGAVAILSPSFKISMAYLSSAVLIATFWLVYFQQPFFSAIALLLMFYFALMILTSKRLNATLRHSLELSLKNHSLLQEIRTKNDNLIESEKTITEALQARSHFLANISHEVRTPLNAIMGTLDILRGEELSIKNKTLVNVAYNSSEHLLELLNSILDTSKNESGDIKLENVCFDLALLLNDVILGFQSRVQEKGIDLQLEIESNIANHYSGDPVKLRQVFNNLVSNAIKFTHKGKVSVHVNTDKQHNNLLHFEITDTGIGIEESKLDSIFTAFSQADVSTTREYGGTGLGLTIVKQLIEAMGGEIDIRSIVGQGSTFFFSLPLNPADTPILLETDCDSPDRSTHKTHTMTFSGLTALLVEDNKVNQLVANSMLKKIGFEVDIAPSGDAAIEMLSIRAYDVIFMDCQMPGRDGFETTRIIRNSEIQETVIIAMTANTTQQDKDQCFAAGMNGFIPKPVNIARIIEEVRRFFPQE